MENAKNFIPEKSVDTLIYQKSEMASLYSIWNKIQNGTYPYYEDTDKHYKYIEDNISRKRLSSFMAMPGQEKVYLL